MNPRLIFASLLVATAATACTSVEDELATEDTSEISDAKADTTGNYTYYTVTHDQRRCVSPLCGGYWVQRVNRSTTRCGDGTYHDACYVADVDWTKLGVRATTLTKVQGAYDLVVRATVGQKNWGGTFGKLGQLRPTEAWIGQGLESPDGVFVKLAETGVRCFTTPCPTFRETKLNGTGTALLADLGWDASGATQTKIGNAITELFEHDLIIAGDRYTVHGPGGTGKARSVTQFYVRAHD